MKMVPTSGSRFSMNQNNMDIYGIESHKEHLLLPNYFQIDPVAVENHILFFSFLVCNLARKRNLID